MYIFYKCVVCLIFEILFLYRKVDIIKGVGRQREKNFFSLLSQKKKNILSKVKVKKKERKKEK